MGSQLFLTVSLSWFPIYRNNLFLVRKMAKGTGRKAKSKAAAQVESAPEEHVAETNQDHTEDSNVPGPSPKIKKGKKGKAVPEIAGGVGAENETVPEELKLSEPSPKAKRGKKNAKIVKEKKDEDEAMASENIAIPEESEADHAPDKTVPEITGRDEAENGIVQEELKPSEPSPKAKKGKKNAKNAPEKKSKKKNEVTEEAIEDVDTNEAVSAKAPEEGAAAVEDMEVSSETVDSTTKVSEEVDEKAEDVKKPSKRANKRNAKASVAVKEEVEEEEKLPAKKTKAAAKKGSTKDKEKIEAVKEEKLTKRANKRNPSPTEAEKML